MDLSASDSMSSLVSRLAAGEVEGLQISQNRGHRTQETGHRTQDTGHMTQDTGHRTQDTGHRTQDTGHILPATAGQGQPVHPSAIRVFAAPWGSISAVSSTLLQ